jgi:hypothetical protein
MRLSPYTIVVLAIPGLLFDTAFGQSSSNSPGFNDLTAPPWLNDLAQARGMLWFGTAADIPGPEQQDTKYMTILNDTNIFGEITPANYMKVLSLSLSKCFTKKKGD